MIPSVSATSNSQDFLPLPERGLLFSQQERVAEVGKATLTGHKRTSRWDQKPREEAPWKRERGIGFHSKKINREIVQIAKDPNRERRRERLVEFSRRNWKEFNEVNLLTLVHRLDLLQEREFFHSGHFLLEIRPKILGFLKSFETEKLIDLVDTFAKVGQLNPELFRGISEEIQERDLRDVESRYLSKLVRAYGKVECDRQLFEKVSQEIQGRDLGDLESYHLCRIVKYYANGDITDPSLFKKISREIQRRDLEDLDSIHLTRTAYAYAKMGIEDEALFGKISREIQRRDLRDFESVQLKDIVRAYGKMRDFVKTYKEIGACNKALFRRISREIQEREDLDSEEWSEISWAYAKVGIYDKPLLRKICRKIRVQDLSLLKLGDVAWSFASMGVFDPQLFEEISQKVRERGLCDFNSVTLSSIAWAYVMYEAETGRDMRGFCAMLVEELFQRGDLRTEERNTLAQVNAFYLFGKELHFEAFHQDVRRSPMEEEVEKYLREFFPESLLTNRFFCGHYPDFIVPEHKLIIEVDGAFHFYPETETFVPKTVFRNCIYERQGYQLLSISSKKWASLKGDQERKDFLLGELQERGFKFSV